MVNTILILSVIFFTTFSVTLVAGHKVENRLVKALFFASISSIVTSFTVTSYSLVTSHFAWGFNLVIIAVGLAVFRQDLGHFAKSWPTIQRSGIMLVVAFFAQLPILGIYESFAGVFAAYNSANVSWFFGYIFALLFIPIGLLGNVISGEMYLDHIHRKVYNPELISEPKPTRGLSSVECL